MRVQDEQLAGYDFKLPQRGCGDLRRGVLFEVAGLGPPSLVTALLMRLDGRDVADVVVCESDEELLGQSALFPNFETKLDKWLAGESDQADVSDSQRLNRDTLGLWEGLRDDDCFTREYER